MALLWLRWCSPPRREPPPKGIFGVFKSCPVSEVYNPASNPICVYEQTADGALRIVP